MTPIRWGIASTGKISNSMATALASIDGAEIVAVGSRSRESAEVFAAEHSIAHAHPSHDELCADPDVDVIYIGSPHQEHLPMTLSALAAGKHVLCEKAFALNASEAQQMVDAARSADRFLMEAMWSWFMPGWHELRRRIADGAIGDVVSLDANFCLSIPNPDGRHRRADMGGGALLDLGIYPLSIARFLLGEPTDVRALGRLTASGVDAALAGSLLHDNGAVSTFSSSLDGQSDLSARIVGTKGRATIDAPFWFPTSFTITVDGDSETVDTPNRGLAHEAEHTMECIRAGRTESDIQTWAATLSNMELMDEIRRQIGVFYPSETGGDVG
jgi:predicted dehydrogenase